MAFNPFTYTCYKVVPNLQRFRDFVPGCLRYGDFVNKWYLALVSCRKSLWYGAYGATWLGIGLVAADAEIPLWLWSTPSQPGQDFVGNLYGARLHYVAVELVGTVARQADLSIVGFCGTQFLDQSTR